ncbi:MAG: extracellular solute-binding protein [Candidatus Buchananbacteria bacterium]|nr:extracellular solute-binding protein [Candidatus Buchananbacteria bacterium]
MKIKTKLYLLILLAVVAVSSGFSCKFITPSQKELLEPIELTWWGVTDEPENFYEVIGDYQAAHPNIKITYRKLRLEEFENELLEALAEDRGPDIFSIHNTWVNKYLSKIEPLPAKTTLAYQVTKTSLGIKQETLIEVRDVPAITAPQLKETFLDVVYNDVVRDNKIYGLPLSVDTLVLFYNRDLLNNAGIPLPPKTWNELQEQVKRLTFQNQNGDLIQSGAALGTAENIERSSDIVSLLMMQNGAEMITGRNVTFGVVPSTFPDQTYNPGPEAVRFYTDFANSSKEVYSWNKTFSNSIDAFAEGRVAMIFGYNYHIPILESKRQGKLNYGISNMPQIEGRTEVNFANYWVNTVSKKSAHINEAWDFIQFITTKKAETEKYLAKTLRPTALRTLIQDQTNNDALAVFAKQLLTAKSWYRGADAVAAENALNEMIESILAGNDLQESVNLAALKIQQTLQTL